MEDDNASKCLSGIGALSLNDNSRAVDSQRNPTTITDLKKNNALLWYKLHVFVYDLHNFHERVDSLKRLDSVVDASYIGMPYFTKVEATLLTTTLVLDGSKSLKCLIGETLDERLERRMSKRVESGDYRVCAAHDLAPIFEKAFDIKPKDLAKDQSFKQLLDTCGLRLNGQSWEGILVKPKFGPQSKGKKKGGKK